MDAITLVNVSNFLYQLSFMMNERFIQSWQTAKEVNMTEYKKKCTQNQTVISVKDEA